MNITPHQWRKLKLVPAVYYSFRNGWFRHFAINRDHRGFVLTGTPDSGIESLRIEFGVFPTVEEAQAVMLTLTLANPT